MRITIQYEAQARRAAGIRAETIDLPDGGTPHDGILQATVMHGDSLRPVLLTAAGEIQPTLLVFVNDVQVLPEKHGPLSDGDTLTLMTPISGG